MPFRRARGIFVTAAIGGIYAWLSFVSLAAILWLVTDQRHWAGFSLLREMAGGSAISLGLGAAAGALLASLLVVSERDKSVATVSTTRFRLWGAIAGAIPAAVFFTLLHMHGASGPLWMDAAGTWCAGSIGWGAAGRMLRLARRGDADRDARSAGAHVG